MGLDITAYRQFTPVRTATARELSGDDDTPEGQYVIRHFTKLSRADGLDPTNAYTATEVMGLAAGSYHAYSAWRETLARIAGYTSAEYVQENVSSGPFYELIDFSDCEGVIGWATSAKLARDFAGFQAIVDACKGPYAAQFQGKYAEWRKAFETAADAGAVVFH